MEPEDVLVLLDNTEIGDAAEGLLLTEDAIHIRDGLANVRQLAVADLQSAEFSGEPMGELKINGFVVLNRVRVRSETMGSLTAMLREMAGMAGDEAELPAMPVADPIRAWLQSIGMERHAALFREHRIQEEQLPGLSDADLRELGIGSLGDRRAILDGIGKLKEQQSKASATEEAQALRDHARRFDRGCLKAAVGIVVVFFVIGLLSGEDDAVLGCVVVGALASLGMYLYSLPAVLAFRRGHEHRWAILIANWLLGVTGVVWIVLLCYSLGLIGSGAAVALGYFSGRK
jgi:hypothetical protein